MQDVGRIWVGRLHRCSRVEVTGNFRSSMSETSEEDWADLVKFYIFILFHM